MCCALPSRRHPSAPFRPGIAFVDPPVDSRPSPLLFPDNSSSGRPSSMDGTTEFLPVRAGLKEIPMLGRVALAALAGARSS